MRSLLSLPLVMASLTLQAQDLWSPVAQEVIHLRRPDSFVLVSTTSQDAKWYGENPLGSANSRDLFLMVPSKKLANAMKRINSGDCWALFSPSSERIAEGRGLPKPSEIRERMQQAGWAPYRERLKSYLGKNPEDYQAWLELAFDVARHAREAKSAGTLGPSLTKSTREELVPCLQSMSKVSAIADVWGDSSRTLIMSLFLAISQAELDRDPDIAAAIQPLAASLRDYLSRDPELERLWYTHGLALRATGWDENTDALVRFAMSFEGVPGRPWPPPFYAFWMRSWYRTDPETIIREGRVILERNLEPELVRRLGRPHVYSSLQAWGGLHLEGLLLQGRVDEALGYISWLRTQSGSGWGQLAAFIRGNLVPNEEDTKGNFDPKPMPALTPEKRGLFHQALAEDPLPDMQLPRCVPMRFAMVGPHNPIQWGMLQNSPTFAPWALTELVWQPLKPDEIRSLKSRYKWEDNSRWVLLKGDDLLASASGQPTAEKLDNVLRTHATPNLEILNAFIKAHPGRLDARRERMEYIRHRLPNPLLEPLFLEDSETLASPLGILPFNPELPLWRPAAKRVCTKLTSKLRHWPFNPEDWLAYSDWAILDPTSKSPASFLASLDTWPCNSFSALPGPIPVAASLAVMKSLISSGRNSEADAWAQVIWENGLKAWLSTWAKLPSLSPNDKASGRYDLQFLEAGELFAQWGNVLTKRGNMKRLAALRSELEGLKPGLSKLLIGANRT